MAKYLLAGDGRRLLAGDGQSLLAKNALPPASEFSPTYKHAKYALSDTGRLATATSDANGAALLAGFKTTGKYWVEIALSGGANVPFIGMGVGTSAFFEQMLGNDADSLMIYSRETPPEFGLRRSNVVTSIPKVAGADMGTGSVMCGLIDLDNRRFFFGYTDNDVGVFRWLTDNPNTTPLGGIALTAGIGYAPGVYTYYGGVNLQARIDTELTQYSNAPAGTTKGWA